MPKGLTLASIRLKGRPPPPMTTPSYALPPGTTPLPAGTTSGLVDLCCTTSGVYILSLLGEDNPENRWIHPFAQAMMRAFEAVEADLARRAAHDDDRPAALLTTSRSAKFFCNGIDPTGAYTKQCAALPPASSLSALDRAERKSGMLDMPGFIRPLQLPIPTICAVNGRKKKTKRRRRAYSTRRAFGPSRARTRQPIHMTICILPISLRARQARTGGGVCEVAGLRGACVRALYSDPRAARLVHWGSSVLGHIAQTSVMRCAKVPTPAEPRPTLSCSSKLRPSSSSLAPFLAHSLSQTLSEQV